MTTLESNPMNPMPRKFEANQGQQKALAAFEQFLASPAAVFILRGSAGTGKTTIINVMTRLLNTRQRSWVALAPTGRAARNLGVQAKCEASTIHSAIYTMSDMKVAGESHDDSDAPLRVVFKLKNENSLSQVFIVDESSMVGDQDLSSDDLQFGSGRLLHDLMQFARLGKVGTAVPSGSKMVFIGDAAQLRPFGEDNSPALCATYLREHFQVESVECELTEVMRQASGNAILDGATKLRDAIGGAVFHTFDLSAVGDEIVAASSEEAVSHIEREYRSGKSSLLITFSNAQALPFNRAVRGRLWGDEAAPLRDGDILLVNRNSAATNLLNGDLLSVVQVGHSTEVRTVKLKGVEYPVSLVFRSVVVVDQGVVGSPRAIECLVLENLLDSPERDLTRHERQALFVDFTLRHPRLKRNSAEFALAWRSDRYVGALEVKYGFALTCHKAQGGEWDSVVVDFTDGRGQCNEDYFRWAYTAVTRAKCKLLTIRAPKFSAFSTMNWGDAQQSDPVSDSVAVKSDEVDARATDPDFSKFKFENCPPKLYSHFQALRAAFAEKGIAITSVRHCAYLEKYTVTRGTEPIEFEFFYKKIGEVSNQPSVRSSPQDSQCGAAVQEVLNRVQFNRPADAGSLDPFQVEFRRRIELAIEGSGVRVVSCEKMDYRLRVTFHEGGRQGTIDFMHGKKQNWTTIQECGGAGRSGGILERVRELVRGKL